MTTEFTVQITLLHMRFSFWRQKKLTCFHKFLMGKSKYWQPNLQYKSPYYMLHFFIQKTCQIKSIELVVFISFVMKLFVLRIRLTSFLAPKSKYSLHKSWNSSRTMDTRWLNPWFFAAQIQIQIPNKYLGFGYKGLVLFRNNGWLMENMDKGLTPLRTDRISE